MIYELQTTVYVELREAADMSQTEVAAAAGISRSSYQRIETGQRLATPAEEVAILTATDTTRLGLAERLCRVIGEQIGRRVKILADEIGYQAATPEGELAELMRLAYDQMDRDRWWAWKERVGRYKALGQLYDGQGLADVRDLTAEVKALLGEAADAAATGGERTTGAGSQGTGGDMLAFRRP